MSAPTCADVLPTAARLVGRAALLLSIAAPAWAAPADIIRSLPAGGSWNQEVKKVVVSMFDTNGSGQLDVEAELSEVGCDMWKAIDEGVRRDWRGATVVSVYGFAEGQFWSGGELGVAEGMRAKARAIMETCGITASDPAEGGVSGGVVGSVVNGVVGGTTAPAGPDISASILAIPAGNTTAWGEQTEALLLGAYDADQTGRIQTLAELGAIPCPVWHAMQESVARDWNGTGLRVIYGFDSDFIWVGHAFSIDESLRTATVIATASCGVGPALGEPAAAITGLPESGQDGWDAFVRRALVSVWDSNGTATLETPAEVSSVTCDTWRAMDRGVIAGWGSGIRQVYGFGPDLMWVGSAVGFDEAIRPQADAAAAACGLQIGVATFDPGSLSGASTSVVMQAIAQTPPGDRWADTIQKIVISAYDLDGSGAVNSGKELKRIPCSVWFAIDKGVTDAWGGTGMRVIYGFQKGFIWVGSALGFDEKVRKSADKAAATCGLM